MSTSNRHRTNLNALESQIGFRSIKELAYRIARGDNFHKLAKEFEVNLYDLRYLRMIPDEVTMFIYERENNTVLRLVYSSAA